MIKILRALQKVGSVAMLILMVILTLLRMESKIAPIAPSTSFSPATSTNVGRSPKNFLTFSLNTFSMLVEGHT